MPPCPEDLAISSADVSRPPPDEGERLRRRRRTREDVTERSCHATRELFALRGYHGPTTREIARQADVSETLLFRFYGSKAGLFEFVYQPFNQLIDDFIANRTASSNPQADEEDLFSAVYELFETNERLFSALLTAREMQESEGGGPPFMGLVPFFKAGTHEQLQKYAEAGQAPSFDADIGLRLGFGMMAASVLLREWLFPEGMAARDQNVAVIPCDPKPRPCPQS